MAITELEYEALTGLHEKGLLPQGGSILELGQSNWYGDVNGQKFLDDAKKFCGDDLVKKIKDIAEANREGVLFEAARACWDMFFAPKDVTSIDFDGQDTALRLDLNFPLNNPLPKAPFDVVMNIGTLEHVFNIAQGFRTVHDVTRVGGLMLHSSPFIGWPDHGFYSVHPTLFFDLAYSNGYKILHMACGEIQPLNQVVLETREDVIKMLVNLKSSRSRMLCCVMKKTREEPFRIPWQGYYAKTLPAGVHNAWHSLR